MPREGRWNDVTALMYGFVVCMRACVIKLCRLQTEERHAYLVPRSSHHFDCAKGSELAQLLVCLVCIDEIVERKGQAGNVTQPDGSNRHGRSETCICR